jgi:23S rRNA (uracil1939-C5)-methyltransferase
MNKQIRRITVKIDRLVYGGLSLGRDGNRIVMIEGPVLPGEIWQVSITKEKKDYSVASVTRVLEPSQQRIEPECGYFGSCGGCQLQYMPYVLQVKQKEDILRDSLKRLAKTDIFLREPLNSDTPWRYRHRGQFKVASGKVGFYRAKSRALVDVEECPLMKDEINAALREARGLLKVYRGREIHISFGDSTVAFLKIPENSEKYLEKLASHFLRSGFAGLVIEAGEGHFARHGKPYITLRLGDLQYSVSAMSFFQSNWRLNQSLVEIIKQSLYPLAGKKVLDLYSGAGNFSLPLAAEAEVTGVEESPHAIEDGRRNLEVNRIGNYRFICSPAEDFKPRGRFDVVLLDPPRPGLTSRVVRTVLALRAERIVYVSCNPATLARDLKKLKTAYDIESIRLIDFFPQTFHIEALVFLRLR